MFVPLDRLRFDPDPLWLANGCHCWKCTLRRAIAVRVGCHPLQVHFHAVGPGDAPPAAEAETPRELRGPTAEEVSAMTPAAVANCVSNHTVRVSAFDTRPDGTPLVSLPAQPALLPECGTLGRLLQRITAAFRRLVLCRRRLIDEAVQNANQPEKRKP